MSTLVLRNGLLDKLKRLHGFESDRALANAIGISFRTLARVKADPTLIQPAMIAGICIAFGYSPSDVVLACDKSTPQKEEL